QTGSPKEYTYEDSNSGSDFINVSARSLDFSADSNSLRTTYDIKMGLNTDILSKLKPGELVTNEETN
ncbi:MAG: hypothetical protein IIT58_05275, partial [Treponema sp.]|nr:hypothetical protein [Treponema sp.]